MATNTNDTLFGALKSVIVDPALAVSTTAKAARHLANAGLAHAKNIEASTTIDIVADLRAKHGEDFSETFSKSRAFLDTI